MSISTWNISNINSEPDTLETSNWGEAFVFFVLNKNLYVADGLKKPLEINKAELHLKVGLFWAAMCYHVFV